MVVNKFGVMVMPWLEFRHARVYTSKKLNSDP